MSLNRPSLFGRPPVYDRPQIPTGIVLNLGSAIRAFSEYTHNKGMKHPLLEHYFATLDSTLRDMEALSGATFTLFPKLPVELRMKIWSHAARIPLVIGLKDKATDEKQPLVLPFSGTGIRCQLVRTCKDAREEVLRIKTNCNHAFPNTPKIYLSVDIDTVYLINYFKNDSNQHSFRDRTSGRRSVPGTIDKIGVDAFKGIKSVAVSYKLCAAIPALQSLDYYALLRFDLKDIIFVLDADNFNPMESATLVKPVKAPKHYLEFNQAALTSVVTWESLAMSDIKKCKEAADNRQTIYVRKLENGVSEEDLVRQGLRDLSDWDIPQFKFMQLVPFSTF